MKPSTILFAAILSALTLPAFADPVHQYDFTVQKTVALKDGGTLYMFQDGKMAVCDKYGNPANVAPGTALQTTTGDTIVIKSNEINRMVNAHSSAWN